MFIKWPKTRRRWFAGEGSDVATSVFHLFRLFDNHTNHIATFPLKLADQRRFFFFFFFFFYAGRPANNRNNLATFPLTKTAACLLTSSR